MQESIKERPILFSAPMVRALLDGSKTQTRRAFSDRTKFAFDCAARIGEVSFFLEQNELGKNDLGYVLDFCPYGKVGDRLWVRETHYEKGDWIIPGWDGAEAEDAYWSGTGKYLYAATDEKPKSDFRTWPSIHMKRKASRINLEITGVRVERLNDISVNDAISEGCTSAFEKGDARGARAEFAELWESINGAGSWQENPFVWVVEFKVFK